MLKPELVEAVGDDLDWLLINAAYGSPTVAVAELSFAGADQYSLALRAYEQAWAIGYWVEH